MAQATEDYTKPPDGSTFLEFCERCCEHCRIVRWIGEENPPKRRRDIYRERFLRYEPSWSPGCPLCQQLIRTPSHLGFEDVLGVHLQLQKLDKTTVTDPFYHPSDRTPYVVLHVRFVTYESTPDWDISFALVGKPGGRQDEVKAKSIEPFVNWKAVREWIGHCQATHSSCARLSDELPLPGLKIIDCETGAVEPFRDNTTPYVALSYVWGDSQYPQEDYPQTVLDSMEAVLALGLRYLWVDRNCIDQKDSVHKSTQIRMMDQIYLRAYLTIISCSDDAGQGLPGVRRLARDPQHSLWLGDRKLEHIYSPAESVGQSRWITRGWTYQEGFMSRRKLFFTRQGVALWCRSMYYEEGVSRSNPDIDEVQEDLVPRIMEGVAPKSLSEHRFELVISKYTMRRVTYEGDTLNACLGILNYLGYKHLWGIVIREQPFSLELCWVPLRNDVPEQEAFPSWSWTRWGSAVKLHPQKYPSSIASIKTRLPSGEEFDILRDTLYTGDLGAICSGKMLRVTGTFLTSPRFSVLEDHGNIYCSIVLSCACGAEIRMMRVNLDMSMGSYASTAAYLDGTEVLEVTPLYKDAKGLFSGQFLLVKRHMDAYRRIGVGGYDEDHWIRHDCRTFKLFGGGFVPMKGCYTKTIDLI